MKAEKKIVVRYQGYFNKEPVNRQIENGYFVVYECENGSIGTWGDYAKDEDDFINDFLRGHMLAEQIKRFTDFDLEIEYGNNKPLGIRKANQLLRAYRKSVGKK